MKSYIIYIIEAFLCSGLFLVLYRWLIVKKPNYGFCRKYLVVTMLLSVVIPMLNVPLYPQQTIYLEVPIMTTAITEPTEPQEAATEFVPTVVAERTTAEPVVTESRLTAEEIWFYSIAAIYLIVLAMSIAFIIKELLSAARLKRRSEITPTPHYQLAVSNLIETPFSFWRTVFIRSDHNDLERSQILSHEASHVAHRHSIEKLFMAVLRSIFWFNPFVWIAERRLEEVQEWQADSDALADGYSVDSYRLTIIKQLFGCNPELTSGAANSLTKIRFMKMKQKDYQGSKFMQTAATVVLSSALFLSFGCGPSDSRIANNDLFDHPANRVIFTVDRFFDDAEDMGNRHYISSLKDKFGQIAIGIETFENYKTNSSTEPYPTVTVAVNHIETAKSPTDWKLRWVKESTNIFVDGKKSNHNDLTSLKSGDYEKIYFHNDADDKFDFVYIEKTKFKVAIYNYTVIIDNLDENSTHKIPDLILPGGVGFHDDVFIYQTHGFNAAAPLAKFAIDGKLVDYATFRQQMNRVADVIIYRNMEAEDRFGKDSKEVVELRTENDVFIRYENKNGSISPCLNMKPADYEQISAAIKQRKIANKQKGIETLVTLYVDSFVPDETYKDLVANCIDTSDNELIYILERYKDSTVTVNAHRKITTSILQE
jgi:beta-lactamase regulating signal transducer with metallopeptidase domain